MAPGRRSIPKRTRIFVGAEGESERSFAAWLQGLCDSEGRHLHLDIVVAGGRSSAKIVETCASRCRERSRKHGPYRTRLVLLDCDRLEDRQQNEADPRPSADGAGIELVFLKPDLEGVLVRLHKGQQARRLATAKGAERALKRLWPEYRKPAPAAALRERFDLDRLRRAAGHDDQLRRLAELLGLMVPWKPAR